MAWLDDRFWCHPKVVSLTAQAYRVYVNGVTYSSGMGTKGHLDSGQQKLIGSTSRQRNELVKAGLWDLNGDSQSIVIHDWDEHNGKRDERRRKDRERKQRERRTT